MPTATQITTMTNSKALESQIKQEMDQLLAQLLSQLKEGNAQELQTDLLSFFDQADSAVSIEQGTVQNSATLQASAKTTTAKQNAVTLIKSVVNALAKKASDNPIAKLIKDIKHCLLYTSPSPRD